MEFGANVDLGYYEQHQTGLNPEKDVLNELWDAFPRLELDRVRSVLALFLFTATTYTRKSACFPAARRDAYRCIN